MPGKSKSSSAKEKQSSRSLSSFFGFSKRNKRSEGIEKQSERNNNYKRQFSEPEKTPIENASNNNFYSLDRKLLNRKNKKKTSNDKNEVIQKYDLTTNSGQQNTHCNGIENGSSSSDEPSNHISARGLKNHIRECKCENKNEAKERAEKLNGRNSLTNLQLKLNGSKAIKNVDKMMKSTNNNALISGNCLSKNIHKK